MDEQLRDALRDFAQEPGDAARATRLAQEYLRLDDAASALAVLALPPALPESARQLQSHVSAGLYRNAQDRPIVSWGLRYEWEANLLYRDIHYMHQLRHLPLDYFDPLRRPDCPLEHRMPPSTDLQTITEAIRELNHPQWGNSILPTPPKRIRAEILPYLLAKPGRTLGLPTRTYRALERSGFRTVDDIITLTFPQLLAYKNIGPKSGVLIEQKLIEIGLHTHCREQLADRRPKASANPATQTL